MPTRRKVQRNRDSRGAGNAPGKRAAPNPTYTPEPPSECVVNGVECVEIDGGRLADVAAEYWRWGLFE